MESKSLFTISRDLTSLEIDFKKRKELIKSTHGCIEILLSFPEELGNAITEAKMENLKGETAYNYLNKKLKEYEVEVLKSLSQERENNYQTQF